MFDMTGSHAQTWQETTHYHVDPTSQPEFGTFLHFDHLDVELAIAGYDHGSSDSQQLVHLSHVLHDQRLQNHFNADVCEDHANREEMWQGRQSMNQDMSQSTDGFSHYGLPQHGHTGAPVFSPSQEPIYHHRQGVPPTPNSIELRGDPHRYLRQINSQQVVFDHFYDMCNDDAPFTPLVSPAVTPHETRFQLPDSSAQGAYFSPLTSPALNAQIHQHPLQHSQNTVFESSTTQSPVDMDIDMLGEAAMISPEPKQRTRSISRRGLSRTMNHNSRIRQSPIVKTHRRKSSITLAAAPKESNDETLGAHSVGQSYGSEFDSISPEPMLSDMPPPPKPGSSATSPAMIAQHNPPATPASLMHIHSSPNFVGNHRMQQSALEELTLPEASLDRPGLSRIKSTNQGDFDTPQISTRKTPKFGPSSTPGASTPNNPSPMLEPHSVPASPAISVMNGKQDLKSVRKPKQRNSASSNLISPALRPKISPSTKPLLPGDSHGTTDNTHALLLASKSNYQNILDGTTVPGVVYPTSLSTNLTSKRTSHKIAEQGRRNRINLALQEMQTLLPSPLIGATEAKSPEMTAQQSNNSKAAKVESAIEYIKQLKRELDEKDELLNQQLEEMHQMRTELSNLKRGSVDVSKVHS